MTCGRRWFTKRFFTLSVLTVFAICGPAARAAEEPKKEDEEEGFVALFDGESLEGFVYDKDLWSVDDGEIVGSTESKTLEHNSFLATKEKYADFVLRVEYKLRNGNSGVQFRSELKDDYVVTGYQADIADNDFLGILYSEGTGRGILVNVKPEEVKEHVNKDDWNTYEIIVQGDHITQNLNGFTTVDFTESEKDQPKEGIIALQLHAGPAMEIRFRNFRIKKL